MKLLFVFLTGFALLSRQCPALAQEGTAAARDRPANPVQPAQPAQAAASASPAHGSQPAQSTQLAELKVCCQKIARDVQRIYYLNNRNGKVRLVVRGIYARGRSLFFSLKMINRSPLDYDVDSIRFFVAEKQNGMQALRRLKELSPVYVLDSLTSVEGYSKAASIYVLPRLTLARHRRLLIEVLEKNGGRHLLVRASNFTLETARLI
jgi:hypothetical protein